jgi:hypothetical protein
MPLSALTPAPAKMKMRSEGEMVSMDEKAVSDVPQSIPILALPFSASGEMRL